MKQRGSIIGPLILITIGVLFLMRTIWPGFSVADFFSVYWPYLLIIWGALQIVEISIRMARGTEVPANGITPGGWFVVLVISLIGFGMYEVRGPESWWRRVSFNQEMDWFGEPHEFAVATQTRTVGTQPHIIIENLRGNAKVAGTDTTQLTLAGHKTIRAMKGGDADRADRATPLEIVQDGHDFIIRPNSDRTPGRVRVSTDLELTVPKNSSLDLSGRSGDIDISALAGNVKISSDDAGVHLQNIGGNVTVDTRHGDIVRCANIMGNVELKGRSSDVELEKISGQVTVSGSYSGTITLREVAKPLHLDNYKTIVAVQKVNGQITMDRGNFSAQNIVGPAQISTHSSDVEVSGFSDALQISADQGDVSLKPSTAQLARIQVKTGAGNIDLALPDGAAFDISASTDRGKIENEFGPTLKIENAGRGERLVGAVGAGPNLNLATDRGSITIRKTKQGELAAADAESPAADVPEASKPSSEPKTPKVPIAPKPHIVVNL